MTDDRHATLVQRCANLSHDLAAGHKAGQLIQGQMVIRLWVLVENRDRFVQFGHACFGKWNEPVGGRHVISLPSPFVNDLIV